MKRAAEDPGERTNLEAFIKTAHDMGAKVTAEWVETQDQIEFVRGMGFDLAQGYVISPPLQGCALAQFLGDGGTCQSLETAA